MSGKTRNILQLGAGLAAFAAAGCAPGDQGANENAGRAAENGRNATTYLAGRVETGLGDRRADAVVVENGEIVFVGSRGEAAAGWGEAEEIDLGDAVIFPGFTDAHAHLLGIGMRESVLNLEGVASLADMQARVAEALSDLEPGEILYGRGWIETHWPEGRFPNRDDLDAVSTEHAIILVRADGHALVANSAAIARAGVDASTEDPDGGQIQRGPDGAPNGIFIDRAQGLVTRLIEAPDEAARRNAYRVGGEVYAAYGWTNIHNMSVAYEDIPLIEEGVDAGAIPIRVYNSVDMGDAEQVFRDGRRVSDSGRAVTRALKLYVDGALGSRGAALLEEYSDAEGAGLIITEHDQMAPVLRRALRDGVQINTHAIGDRGNRNVLDWYAEAFAEAPPGERAVAEPRWRIEHAQILHPDDIARFAELGVIPSMQPSHAIGDLHFAPDRLGLDRLVGAYAWRSLIDSGAIIAAGSDAPVERGDPRIEFYAAVARKDLTGFAGEGWHAEQAVTREEALKMLTLWPAYAAFQEDILGTIEPGKRADFTIFDRDLMTVPEAEILEAQVVMTVVDGEIVYRAAD
ncbi:MAG: amidohydrolase [Parvularculaceae bacterium]